MCGTSPDSAATAKDQWFWQLYLTSEAVSLDNMSGARLRRAPPKAFLDAKLLGVFFLVEISQQYQSTTFFADAAVEAHGLCFGYRRRDYRDVFALLQILRALFVCIHYEIK